MSDLKLPLWNKEETDILPQFQLSYGHVLCQYPLTGKHVAQLAKQFGFGSMRYDGDLDSRRLPADSQGCHSLEGEHQAHLIVGRVAD